MTTSISLLSPSPFLEPPVLPPPIIHPSPPSQQILLQLTLALAFVLVIAAMLKIRFAQSFQFYCKLAATIVAVIAVSIIGTVLSILVPLVQADRRQINYYVAKIFAAILSPFVGVKFRIIDPHHNLNITRPCVFVCNHQSTLDLLSLAAIFPPRTIVMAKKALSYYPFLGLYMKLAKNCFVDRSDHSSALKSLATVSDFIHNEGCGLFVFPEGTRSHQTTNNLLSFKKGAFHLALKKGIPIVPIVFSTYALDVSPIHSTSSSPIIQNHILYSSKLRRFDGGDVVIKGMPLLL